LLDISSLDKEYGHAVHLPLPVEAKAVVEALRHPQEPPPAEAVLFTSSASGGLVGGSGFLGLGMTGLCKARIWVVPGAVLIRVPTLFLFRWLGRPRYWWHRIEAAHVGPVQVIWAGYFLAWAFSFSFFARDRTRGLVEAHLLPLSALSFRHVGERTRRFLGALRHAGFQVEDHFGIERRSDFALWFWARGSTVLAAAVLVAFIVVAERLL
jgi:hypothetical protein